MSRDEEPLDIENKIENLQKWDLSRRKMMKIIGGVALAGMTVAWLPKALRDAPGLDDQDDEYRAQAST